MVKRIGLSLAGLALAMSATGCCCLSRPCGGGYGCGYPSYGSGYAPSGGCGPGGCAPQGGGYYPQTGFIPGTDQTAMVINSTLSSNASMPMSNTSAMAAPYGAPPMSAAAPYPQTAMAPMNSLPTY